MNEYISQLRNNKLDGNLKLVNYCDKTIELINSESDMKKIISYPKICLLLARGILSEMYEINARKKYMSKVFKCSIDRVAGDINDLIKLKDKTYLFATDFTYSSVIYDEWLKNIRVIWGDAYLYALDDINKLSSIKYITGKIYYKNNIYTFEELKQEFIQSKRKIKK